MKYIFQHYSAMEITVVVTSAIFLILFLYVYLKYKGLLNPLAQSFGTKASFSIVGLKFFYFDIDVEGVTIRVSVLPNTGSTNSALMIIALRPLGFTLNILPARALMKAVKVGAVRTGDPQLDKHFAVRSNDHIRAQHHLSDPETKQSLLWLFSQGYVRVAATSNRVYAVMYGISKKDLDPNMIRTDIDHLLTFIKAS